MYVSICKGLKCLWTWLIWNQKWYNRSKKTDEELQTGWRDLARKAKCKILQANHSAKKNIEREKNQNCKRILIYV